MTRPLEIRRYKCPDPLASELDGEAFTQYLLCAESHADCKKTDSVLMPFSSPPPCLQPSPNTESICSQPACFASEAVNMNQQQQTKRKVF